MEHHNVGANLGGIQKKMDSTHLHTCTYASTPLRKHTNTHIHTNNHTAVGSLDGVRRNSKSEHPNVGTTTDCSKTLTTLNLKTLTTPELVYKHPNIFFFFFFFFFF